MKIQETINLTMGWRYGSVVDHLPSTFPEFKLQYCKKKIQTNKKALKLTN
jgi:hypothetical protein